MLKKIFLGLAVAAVFSMQGFAQQSGSKVLVVIHSSNMEDRFLFSTALWHAMDLKKAGVDVRVIVEGNAVLYFYDNTIGGSENAQTRFTAVEAPTGVEAPPAVIVPPVVSTAPTTGPVAVNPVGVTTAVNPAVSPVHGNGTGAGKNYRLVNDSVKHTFQGKSLLPREMFNSVLNDFKNSKIPYTLCAFSAVMVDKYDQLKALGAPLSDDPGNLIDIAPYVKDNYQVIVF